MRIIFLIALIFNFFLNDKVYSKETYVVFKVNNKIITNVDIDNEYKYLTALSPSLSNIAKKQVDELAKDSIIREKIKEEEIIKYFDLYNVENKLIEKIIKEFYLKLGIQNKSEFKNYLLTYDLNYQDVKKKITIEAAWNDLVYKKFSSKIEIDKKEIKSRINKLISNKEERNLYHLSEILFTAEDYNDLQKKYKTIEKNILEIGFDNAANIHSIADTAKLGGKVGWVNESQLNEIIYKEIINLNIKDYTKPITIPGGFLIIRLDDIKKEKKNINFDEEFNKQIAIEKNSQLNQFSEIYFKKIKKNSVISEK
tara:strand:+ start:4390 stop:5322 length:933 start_codon:yes stop_codon:yes gene_type:complete